MVMEPRHDEFSDYINTFSLDDESILPLFGQSPGLANGYRFREEPLDLSFLETSNSAPNSCPYSSDSSSRISPQSDSPDDFSDCVFKYINQILVEEDMEAKQSLFHDPLALQATEKSFYEALGEKYLPPTTEIPEENLFSSSSEYSTNSSNSNDSHWPGADSLEAKSSVAPTPSLENPLLSSFGSTTSVNNDGFGTLDSMINTHIIENIFTDNESILQFNRGMEEASKFLPPSKPLVIDLDKYNLPTNSRKAPTQAPVKEETVETDYSPVGSKGRKKYHREDIVYEEERSSKQSAVYVEQAELADMFDRIILCTDSECSSSTFHEEPAKQVTTKKWQQNGQAHRYTSGWIDRSWGGSSGEPTDVRTLLVNCAQAVATDDYITANEHLKQIRQHASPSGDAPQRLAHMFATALEARLAGIGSHHYASKIAMRISAAEKLKAYQAYLQAAPFKKIAFFFAAHMIYEGSLTSSTLHIVDFGIAYGCQWPVLIKHLATRPGGPPTLRITGIDLPEPGFRPAERLKETGRRLAEYCARFNVPFEFNVIATQNWELIKVEDLKLQRNEFLAVNNLIRFKNLHDDSVMVSNPRDGVLKVIRDMKPDVFVLTVVNGSYSSPFFVTRFKEALFHFSSIFDMLDATLEREDEERLNFETEFCGREAMNVIACEGAERVERPETYKQWQARNLRAGFKLKSLDRAFVSKLRGKVKAGYHKDFVFDDDGKWVLQGWKGRILRASSCWVPA